MPISRFGSVLLSKGQFHDYMSLLKSNYSEQNLEQVMCRHLISVDWRGEVYDCDFNQMLDLPMTLVATDRPRLHLRDLLALELEGESIAVADHCYGCTAGQGSGCGGALWLNSPRLSIIVPMLNERKGLQTFWLRYSHYVNPVLS